MSNFIFNSALGKVADLAQLPGADDSLIAVPLSAAGVEADDTMRPRTTLADVLSASTEQTTMTRITLTNVTVTPGLTAFVDADDVVWPAATGDAVASFLICYKPTAASADTDILPLVKLDMAVTPAGGDITYQFDSSGFFSAANAV